MNKLELLAPAKNLDCGLAAINHGADAVYIGGPKFGARKQAGNPLGDIASLVTYAHRFRAKVYVALNTILFDNELDEVQKLIHQLHNAGADALIVQDMGILEMDLPPIALHASTQTDNRTWQKVEFLEKAGFGQVVLARELSLKQITEIRSKTNVNLEFFVHGALCVSYSGQCYMSQAINGRSANRGECGQPCRLTYSLVDGKGNTIEKDRHLLSLKDLNLSNYLQELAEAGINSFKIEGRLKDMEYVKNITSWYRQKIDTFLETDHRFAKSSSGRCTYIFNANPEKSFSRGFTNYFIHERHEPVWSPDSPKSLGEKIGRIARIEKDHFLLAQGSLPLSNGDGLCFFDKKMEMVGLRVNRSEGLKVYPANMKQVYAGALVFRNHDKTFNDLLERSGDNRKIAIHLHFDALGNGQFSLTCIDEDGVTTKQENTLTASPARNPEAGLEQIRSQLGKMGGTVFTATIIDIAPEAVMFIPAKELNEMRRTLMAHHEENREALYPSEQREFHPTSHLFPEQVLTYRGNVTNRLARQFYQRHGVTEIHEGFELLAHSPRHTQVMTTKHCILFSIGKCLRTDPDARRLLPLKLINPKDEYRLEFDCKACEMKVVLERHKQLAKNS
ncbi:MAG: U32 family peptidase [Breznakibacter sp.]